MDRKIGRWARILVDALTLMMLLQLGASPWIVAAAATATAVAGYLEYRARLEEDP